AKDQKQIAYNISSKGFESSVDPKIIFGLGKNDKIDSLRVIWPDFKSEIIKNPQINTKIELVYSQDLPNFILSPSIKSKPFLNVSSSTIGDIVQKENYFVDYDYEFLLPTNSQGQNMVMYGYIYWDTTTVAQLRHYAEDRGASQEEIDAITEPVAEYMFKAKGVKIERPTDA
ncbi:MAG: DUF4920 domain-containing protein, partial [Flavobacteriaceae bacterium]|nr:DUF4920 domain-containing protein [Flavobacteriaceae bacterium]